jgi:hypothetical protein
MQPWGEREGEERRPPGTTYPPPLVILKMLSRVVVLRTATDALCGLGGPLVVQWRGAEGGLREGEG